MAIKPPLCLHLVGGWQRTRRERDLTCPFFWRTTAPGIPDCASFTEPVNNITKMEIHVATEANPGWGWDKFWYQNDIALDMLDLAETEGLSYEIIDGYRIDIQHPDRHACTKCKRYDCLHQYYPDVANAHDIIFCIICVHKKDSIQVELHCL